MPPSWKSKKGLISSAKEDLTGPDPTPFSVLDSKRDHFPQPCMLKQADSKVTFSKSLPKSWLMQPLTSVGFCQQFAVDRDGGPPEPIFTTNIVGIFPQGKMKGSTG